MMLLSLVTGLMAQTPRTFEDNRICMDPISGIGRGAYINTARTSNVLSASASIDGVLSNSATIDLGATLGSGYRLAISDSLHYYPAGNAVGFVFRYRNNGVLGLLDAALLNQLVIRTYRNGTLQETANFTNGTGLLSANVLSGAKGQQTVSFVTTREFDEAELAYTGAVLLGRTLDVFYAFEGPADCPAGCVNAILTAGENATATSGQAGLACLLGSVSDVGNVVDADSANNAATITSTVGLACTRFINVRSATTYPGGYEAGFVVDNGPGLIDLNLLGGVTVSTYLDGTLRESLSGSSLLATSVLGGSTRMQIGVRTNLSFNSIRVSLTGISVAVTLRVYHAYVKADSDGDGVSDCMDRCVGPDDLDTDGDGVLNGCDQDIANVSITKTASSATATVGSSVSFIVRVERTGPFFATGLVIRDTLSKGLTYLTHTAPAGTNYNPTNGQWTIGSALGGVTTNLSLTVTARVDSVGVNSSVASVLRLFETDPNPSDNAASACVSVPIRFCEGGAVMLSAPANLTAGVEWFRTVGNTTTSVATTPTFSASLSGSYSYTATGASGCLSGNCCPVILAVDPIPAATIVASTSVVCAGGGATLTASSDVPGATFVWNTSETTPTISVTPTVATVYSVTVLSAGGCFNVVSYTIGVNPTPVQAPIVAICAPIGQSGYSFNVNPATTSGGSASYFVKVGSAAEAGPFPYGEARTFSGNTGTLAVVIRDASTSCTTTQTSTPPVNCPTCPPKVCVPIVVQRM